MKSSITHKNNRRVRRGYSNNGRKNGSNTPNGKDPILALSGVGKEIWKGVNADDYVRKLREGW